MFYNQIMYRFSFKSYAYLQPASSHYILDGCKDFDIDMAKVLDLHGNRTRVL